MTWLLSGAAREAARDQYRRAIVRAALTYDLRERAVLQASARRLFDALHGSAFDGAAIVLLCEGDDTYTYEGDETAPLHCTVCFLGSAGDMPLAQRHQVVDATGQIAGLLDPFDAQVTSPATFGTTPVRLVEHEDINLARQMALSDPTVDAYAATYEDHPHYIPHVSGLDDREKVRFDRIAALLGGEDHVFPLGEPYRPPQPGFTPPQTPDLDRDLETQPQGVLT